MDNDFLISMITGDVKEDKQYYTDQMFSQELTTFIMFVLENENILDVDKYNKYKNEFVRMRNKEIIEGLKDFNSSK